MKQSGVVRGLANSVGIAPELAVPGGAHAAEAMAALKQARAAGGGSLRMSHLARAQQHIAALDFRRHRALVQHLQAHVLALQGRGKDTKIAHVAMGEVVVPRHLQTPAVVAALGAAARQAGLDPASLRIGSGRNAINPRTGLPEFDEAQYQDGSGDLSADGGDYEASAHESGYGPDTSAGSGVEEAADPNAIENITVTAPRDQAGYGTPPSVPDPSIQIDPPTALNDYFAAQREAQLAALLRQRQGAQDGLAYLSYFNEAAPILGYVIGGPVGAAALPGLGVATHWLTEYRLAQINRQIDGLNGKAP